MPSPTEAFQVGQHVAVTQQIPQRDAVWSVRVEGEIVKFEQKKTGSWFAHSKDDRLWLDRLVIRKADGEIVTLLLDAYTHIEKLATPEPPEVEETGDDEAEGESETDDEAETKDSE